MQAVELKINPRCTIEFKEIGSFGTQVLMVDDFLENPEEVRTFGLTLRYATSADYYPGVKAEASLKGMNEAALWVGTRMLEKVLPAQSRPSWLDMQPIARSRCEFAVYSYDRARLPPNFTDQHVDGAAWLATVLQLSHDTASRGTAFWQHRPSGFESWFAGDAVQVGFLQAALGLRLEEQIAAAVGRVRIQHSSDVQDIFNAAQRPTSGRRALTLDEDEQWKLIDFVPAKFNRLVAYPTWQLHSGVDDTNHGEVTPENMRMTLNQFVHFPFADPKLCPPRRYPPDFGRPVQGVS